VGLQWTGERLHQSTKGRAVPARLHLIDPRLPSTINQSINQSIASQSKVPPQPPPPTNSPPRNLAHHTASTQLRSHQRSPDQLRFRCLWCCSPSPACLPDRSTESRHFSRPHPTTNRSAVSTPRLCPFPLPPPSLCRHLTICSFLPNDSKSMSA